MNETQADTLHRAAQGQQQLVEQLRALPSYPELERAVTFARAAADELADACHLAGRERPDEPREPA